MVSIVSCQELERFTTEIFQKCGFAREDASLISESLVLADLRGVESHGVVRVPIYAEAIERGLISPEPKVKVLKKRRNFALIDGDNTLGAIPGDLAVKLAISMAKENGMGIAGIRNLRHSGMLANYVLKIVNEKLFGLAIANASPNVALQGFRKPILGTNPVAIGFPVDGSTPLLLDMAMSLVARGRVLIASKKGEQIPKGWAVNEQGDETTDPDEAIKGALLPIGGYKGLGLAMVVDIICGIVLGGQYGLNIERSWFSQGGLLVLASRLDVVRSYDEYLNELREYIKKIKATPVSPGTMVMLPNEKEQMTFDRRVKEGIPLEDGTYEQLIRLAKKYGVDPPKFL